MDNSIIEVLRYMRNTYGEDIFYNFSKSKNLLNDLCPMLTQERIQAKNFIELNGYFMLKYAGNAYSIVRNKLINTYISTYRVDEQTAVWITDVFGTLLGNASLDSNVKIELPATQAMQAMPVSSPERVRASQMAGNYASHVKDGEVRTVAAPGGRIITPLTVKQLLHAPSEALQAYQPVFRDRSPIAADFHTVAIRYDGRVMATGYNNAGQCNLGNWHDIVSVAAGSFFTVGLCSDGTVMAAGLNDYGQCDVSRWRDIIAISAGSRHTLGLRRDGSVVAAGENQYGECSVSGWRNITTIVAGDQCTYAIKKDRKVLARGNNKHGEYDVARLSDVVGLANAYPHGAIALKSDGTVQKACRGMKGDFRKIKNIAAIAATPDCFIGLTLDGRVRILAYYWESSGVECSTDDWENIVAITAGRYHVVGLRSDGTLKAAMMHTHETLNKGQCDVTAWSGLRV